MTSFVRPCTGWCPLHCYPWDLRSIYSTLYYPLSYSGIKYNGLSSRKTKESLFLRVYLLIIRFSLMPNICFYDLFDLVYLSSNFLLTYLGFLAFGVNNSPKLKAQLSFFDTFCLSDRLWLSVCRSVRLKTFHIFDFFSKASAAISFKLGTKHI